MRLTEIWPLVDLVVRTPRLVLRYADDDRAAALMDLAATQGVHGPDERPFRVPWALLPSPTLERGGMQAYWRDRAAVSAETWVLPFAVYEGEELVASQTLRASGFAVTRTVLSGSWVARPRQGRGIGKEMRAAVLHLAFAGLGAQQARTGAFADNPASIVVTRALGYVDNGWQLTERAGAPVRDLAFLLERAVWERSRRDDIEIDGLDACLPLLGL